MFMRDRIRKFKRDRLRDRIIANGERLDRVYRSRNGVDSALWPDDCAHLDNTITNLERRRDSLLQKFKEN